MEHLDVGFHNENRTEKNSKCWVFTRMFVSKKGTSILLLLSSEVLSLFRVSKVEQNLACHCCSKETILDTEWCCIKLFNINLHLEDASILYKHPLIFSVGVEWCNNIQKGMLPKHKMTKVKIGITQLQHAQSKEASKDQLGWCSTFRDMSCKKASNMVISWGAFYVGWLFSCSTSSWFSADR